MKLTIQSFPTVPGSQSAYVDYWKGSFRTSPSLGEAAFVEEAGEADIILFVDGDWSFEYRALRRHPLVRERPGDCYLLDELDRPLDFLPGLYAAMPRARFDPSRHRAFCYPYNQSIVRNTALSFERAQQQVPDLLMSFVGGPTARVRKLLQSHQWNRPDVVVENTLDYQHWNLADDSHRASRQWHYADVLARSKFVLCPRGAGTGSIRLFETMQMGRCPVILSDHYVLPQGLDWNACSVLVPERDWRKLEDILRGRESEAAELGRVARREWERLFSPAALPRTVVRHLLDLRAVHGPSYFAKGLRWSKLKWSHRLRRWLAGIRRQFLPGIVRSLRSACGAHGAGAR